MSENLEMSGKCLCGAVRFTARAEAPHVGACHCGMCRRWTSGPFMAVELSEPPSFTGEDQVGVYRSSEWGERGFCQPCGTTLFWRMPDGAHYGISAGALDSQNGLIFRDQIFIDEKPAFYHFANDTKKMTGPEVMAQFTSAEGKDA